MFKNVKCLESSEGNIWKYIYEKDDAIVESVLYKYNTFNERTVICCSVQSGCPVGCKFCGTGSRFIRNLTADEIVFQIEYILKDKNIENINRSCNKFQIMFMSMGEPMLNWENVERAIRILNNKYPNADLLLSTIGVNNPDVISRIIKISKDINKVGLQFSIHKSTNRERDLLIPFKNKLNIQEIRDFGLLWWKETGRKPYLNYCVDGENNSETDFTFLFLQYSPLVFNLTFSVVCSADETMKDAGFRNKNNINEFMGKFMDCGYNVRMFDPAGQDDIGGGCGQLWHVQKWLNNFGM